MTIIGIKESYSEERLLNAESIDYFSEKIESFLGHLEVDRANIIRIRFSLEEALLRWRDRFGEEAAVTFTLGVRWRRPTISIRLMEEEMNPLVHYGDGSDLWGGSLLSGIGLKPRYAYKNGANVVELVLQPLRINPAMTLLMSVVLGILLGVVGKAVLPDQTLDVILTTVLDPIHNVFFRILSVTSGPVIFLSVLQSICGIGSVTAMGRAGRQMIYRFIRNCVLVTLVSIVVTSAVLGLNYNAHFLNTDEFSGALDFLLQIIPGDIASPFISGDSPQLILMALVLGYALLVMGNQGNQLTALVEQANTLALMVAGWVSGLVPFFAFALLILGVWNGSVQNLLDMWKPFALYLVLGGAVQLYVMNRAAKLRKVSLKQFWEWIKPSFLIALKNASVDASFGANANCCEKMLKVPKSLTSFGLPLGLVIYMPAGTICCMVFVIYSAVTYGVSGSLLWCLIALVLNVTLIMATPPVPGVGILTYAAIFARLGIPSEALTAAMMADIIFGFLVSPMNQAMLQAELVVLDSKLNVPQRVK